MRKVLTVILAHADVGKQQAHLQKGALFLPEPEPPPEPFAEIVLRVEIFAGTGVDLDARVLQILEGRGIAVTFDDLAAAKAKLAPVFESSEPGEDEATFVFWGRGDSKKRTSLPPRKKVSARPSRKSVKPSSKRGSKRPIEIDPALDMLAQPGVRAPKEDAGITIPAPPAAMSAPRIPAAAPLPDSGEAWGDTLPRIPIAKPVKPQPPGRRVLVVPMTKAGKAGPAANAPPQNIAMDTVKDPPPDHEEK